MTDLLFLMLTILDILTTPFTGVEESFILHATHDVLMYGVGSSTLHNVNHSFPKSVTFLQPIRIVRSLHISGSRSTYFRRQRAPCMVGETIGLDYRLVRKRRIPSEVGYAGYRLVLPSCRSSNCIYLPHDSAVYACVHKFCRPTTYGDSSFPTL